MKTEAAISGPPVNRAKEWSDDENPPVDTVVRARTTASKAGRPTSR